jgi:REP element-mobilizing transposase RayT
MPFPLQATAVSGVGAAFLPRKKSGKDATMKYLQPPHSHALRKGRHSQPGQIYLITTITHQRQPFFKEFELGRIVVNSIAYLHHNGYIEQMAYVIMPDHLHWLFALKERRDISAIVGMLKGYSSRQIKAIHTARSDPASGAPLWQKSFHDHALRQDEELLHVARYIVANPLRAGLVERLGDYPLWDAVWL